MFRKFFATASILFASNVLADEGFLLEDLPDHITASVEAREKIFAKLPQNNGAGFEFFLDDLQSWSVGQTVKVAFLGGTSQLHSDIANATKQITDNCNLKLDFGFDGNSGQFRTWTTNDSNYSAEIRVSFDQKGYFSLVGTDSTNPAIGGIGEPVGGRANQRSLNLGGFDTARPASWMKTVRHEFLHALAFNHEHQSPMGGCDSQFRWDDDAGYQFTKDANGQYIVDNAGKRPGIYTYLSGAPNNWSRAKVDFNLRQASTGSGSAGPFDRESIMLYRFPSLFYVSNNSSCTPVGAGDDLSAGDIAGLKKLYPQGQSAVAAVEKRFNSLKAAVFNSMESIPEVKGLHANRLEFKK